MKYALRLEMESVAGNVWPLENYNESDFDCLMAEALTTSPIFTDEPWMPSEQFQPNQEQVQFSGQPQAQALPQPQLPPFQSLVNFPVHFPTGPRSRRIKLQERDPGDLSFKDARKKWQEAFWLQEENMKVQELIMNKNSAIFVQSEKARLAKMELAKTNLQLAKAKKMLAKCEERSRKIALANARMLKYISEKI